MIEVGRAPQRPEFSRPRGAARVPTVEGGCHGRTACVTERPSGPMARHHMLCHKLSNEQQFGRRGKGTYVPISPIISACRFPGDNGPWNTPDRSAGRGKVKEGLDNRYNSGGDSSNDSGNAWSVYTTLLSFSIHLPPPHVRRVCRSFGSLYGNYR